MKETRASILLIFSLILFVVSLVILTTWGYNRYYNAPIIITQPSPTLKNSSAPADGPAKATRDSLENIYSATINRLGSKIDTSIMYADSLRIPMNNQVAEYAKLRNEVVELLKEKNGTADLELAKEKIAALQIKVKDLLGKYDMVESENKRLLGLLKQVAATKSSQVAGNTSPVIPASYDTSPSENSSGRATTPVVNTRFFSAYDMHLTAYTVTDNKEIETAQAYQTDKFIGSFIVKNPNPTANSIEMVVVITRPDGRVIQKSTWESGTFELVDGSKQIYSMKLRFDYTKGEPKKLLFSVAADDFPSGTYTMHVYHNGALLGKTSKILR